MLSTSERSCIRSYNVPSVSEVNILTLSTVSIAVSVNCRSLQPKTRPHCGNKGKSTAFVYVRTWDFSLLSICYKYLKTRLVMLAGFLDCTSRV